MKVAILSNRIKDKNLVITNILVDKLKLEGIFVAYNISFSNVLDDVSICKLRNSDVDVAIVLGGDGSILQATKVFYNTNVAILGINLGKKGFMCTAEKDQLDKVVASLKNNEYRLESTYLLSVSCRERTYIAVNDIIVGKNEHMKLIPTKVLINNEEYYTYHSDGVLVSSSTGSTAYYLSAGGPIIAPGARCLGIVGICQHSLFNRSLIVDSTATIQMIPLEDDANLYVDGRCEVELKQNEEVTIRQSDCKIDFIRFFDDNFYKKLMKKLVSIVD